MAYTTQRLPGDCVPPTPLVARQKPRGVCCCQHINSGGGQTRGEGRSRTPLPISLCAGTAAAGFGRTSPYWRLSSSHARAQECSPDAKWSCPHGASGPPTAPPASAGLTLQRHGHGAAFLVGATIRTLLAGQATHTVAGAAVANNLWVWRGIAHEVGRLTSRGSRGESRHEAWCSQPMRVGVGRWKDKCMGMISSWRSTGHAQVNQRRRYTRYPMTSTWRDIRPAQGDGQRAALCSLELTCASCGI